MIGEDKDRGWEIFWGVYVVILGLIFVFLVPPFQKPDEIVHWYYALALANKDSLAEKRLVDLPKRFKADKIAFHHEIRFSIDQLTYREANREWIDFSQYRSRLINPFSYLPAIIGIWIGDYFETPIVSFWLARLIGLIFFLMAVIWSIRVAGRTFRDLILMYAFLPMVLHQASSVSYDVMP